MSLKQLSILGDFLHSGTLSAGTLWQPSAAAVAAVLAAAASLP